jgi:hypothetical protein
MSIVCAKAALAGAAREQIQSMPRHPNSQSNGPAVACYPHVFKLCQISQGGAQGSLEHILRFPARQKRSAGSKEEAK